MFIGEDEVESGASSLFKSALHKFPSE